MRGNGWNESSGMRGILLIMAVFLVILAVHPARTGMKIVVEDTLLSVEMTAPFFRMAFDIGQERSKTDSRRAIVG